MMKRRRQATKLYLLVIAEIERRRAQLGWPIWLLELRSGISDGHYAHLITPDSPSGRQASWDVLQEIVDAMYGPVTLRISRAGPEKNIRVPSRMAMIRNSAIRSWWRARQSEMGIKGGLARAAALTPKQRSDSARRAVKARWKRHREQAKQNQG